jgi:arginase
MRAQLLGVPTALGIPRNVSQEGPAALRRLGLVQALGSVLEVTDLGDVSVAKGRTGEKVGRLLHKVMVTARRQAGAVADAYAADSLPISIGGDRTASLGTAMALAKLGQSFDLVWLGAHGSFNTPITSRSGHPHGMVLAILAGLTPYLPQIVAPYRLHLWGVRDLDSWERSMLGALGVEVRDVAGTRAGWAALLGSLSQNVFLSFDCDCCQPAVAPGTMTPVRDGFERAEVLRIVQQISERRRVVALDVVELHPDLDRHDRTAMLARDVILTVAAAQARREGATRIAGRLSSTRSESTPLCSSSRCA